MTGLRGLWLLAFAGVAALVLWQLSQQGSVPPEQAVMTDVAAKPALASNTVLHERVEPVGRRAATRADDEVGKDLEEKPRDLGPLPSAQLGRLLQAIGVRPSAVALATAQTAAESGKRSDYVAYLKEKYSYLKVLQAEERARRGRYITLPMNDSLSAIPPDNHVMLGQIGVGFIGDERVSAMFWFDLSKPENREIAEAKTAWELAKARPY
tara:strand:- start:348 stop:977 length:630 start_codon:yes stop_codon:yes gene_type:complete